MRKIHKNFLRIILIFAIFYIIFGINKVFAVGVSVSSSTINQGENTTVTIGIPNGYVGYDGTISFDSSKLTYVSSTTGNLVGGNIKVADANTSLGQVNNFSITFKGNNVGSANVSANLTLCNSDGSPVSASGSGTVTIKAVQPATPAPTTNPEPSTPAQQPDSGQPEPNATPAPAPESKQPSFKDVNDKVYATKSMNVRESWSTSSKKVGGLSYGQEVTRTGIGDNGWSRINYNGKTAYVSTGLITTTKPPEKTEVPETTPDTETKEGSEEPEKVEEKQKGYVSEDIKIKKSGNINSEDIGEVLFAEEVTILEKFDGWIKISYNGIEGFVMENQILETKPEKEEKTEEQLDEEFYQQLVDKIGTIPEVGTNINNYIVIAISIFSIISLILILKIKGA